MSHSWGIDLGTTNSCISRIVGGRPQAVAIDGDPIVPSVVLFEGERVVVGRAARNLELAMPERCVRSVKRRMGRGPDYEIAGRTLSPEQISAEILRALKLAAEQITGESVDEVVITVPAYFDDAQRRATLRAGELAGLRISRLLNEPTSASLLYDRVGAAREDGSPEIMLVYDLGGGTFDVSVLEVFGDVREVRATAGNTQLGGDDFDELLYRRFVDELKRERGVDVRGDMRARARLRNAAERTKIALSTALEYDVSEEFVAVDGNGAPVHLSTRVTRREFEALIEPLLKTTLELTRRALDDARLLDQRLSRICLVGGSTRIPLVRALLADAFDAEVHEEVNPDLAVALGASVQAGILGGEPVERILVDVSAHSLGIRVVGGQDADGFDPSDGPDTFAPVLRRNSVLPGEKAEQFYTVVDNQKVLRVDVFQGESRRCSENRLVGTFDVALEPRPSHSPIDVLFAYDLDGVVRVTVSQSGTANAKTVQLRLADGSGVSADSPVLRKARTLLEELEPEAKAALTELITHYEHAQPDAREQAEEALLDFLLEQDSAEDNGDLDEPGDPTDEG